MDEPKILRTKEEQMEVERQQFLQKLKTKAAHLLNDVYVYTLDYNSIKALAAAHQLKKVRRTIREMEEGK